MFHTKTFNISVFKRKDIPQNKKTKLNCGNSTLTAKLCNVQELCLFLLCTEC